MLTPIILMLVLLASCSDLPQTFQNSRTRLLDAITSEESQRIKEMSNEIIRCFSEKDSDALKNLFCEQVRINSNIDKEVDEALEFLDIDIYTTSTIKETASGGSHTSRGERVAWYLTPEIPYLSILTKIDSETDSRGYEHERFYYSIHYYWQLAYKEDKSLEGLHYIIIDLLNVDSIKIGQVTSITNRQPSIVMGDED